MDIVLAYLVILSTLHVPAQARVRLEAEGAPRSDTNTGKEFVVMFMLNQVTRPLNMDLELYITGERGSELANVRVSTPLLPHGFHRNFSIPSGTVQEVFISRDLVEHKWSGVGDCGVHITSDVPVVVYGLNKERFSADSFLALPVDSLGVEYYAVCFSPPTYHTEMGIVAALVGSTSVAITLPSRYPAAMRVRHNNILYYGGIRETYGTNNSYLSSSPPAAHFTETLLQYQTMLVTGYTRDDDLTGSRVVCSQPCAFFSGNIRTKVALSNSRDHLVEQLPPVKSWGRRFVVPSTPHRTVGDELRVVGAAAKTIVHIDNIIPKDEEPTIPGNSTAAEHASGAFVEDMLQWGDYGEYILPSGLLATVHCSEPCIVMMIVRSQDGESVSEQADPAMIVVPPVEQYSRDYSFLALMFTRYNESGSTNYTTHMTMVMKKDYTAGILLDDKHITDIEWNDVAGTKYTCGSLAVPQGPHHLGHSDPRATYMAIMYGAADRESYGHPLGLLLRQINPCDHSTPTPGDGVDNDCDGSIDEEVKDSKDNDGDGRIDEDLDCSVEVAAGNIINVCNTEKAGLLPFIYYCPYPSHSSADLTLQLEFTPLEQLTNVAYQVSFPLGNSTLTKTFNASGRYLMNLSRPTISTKTHDCRIYDTVTVLIQSSHGVQVLLVVVNSDGVRDPSYLLPLSLYSSAYRAVHLFPSDSTLTGLYITSPSDDCYITIRLPVMSTPFKELSVLIDDVYSNGDEISFILQKHQTYKILVYGDLTDTFVIGSKPFALFSYIQFESARILKQVPGLSSWSTTYVLQSNSVVRALSRQGHPPVIVRHSGEVTLISSCFLKGTPFSDYKIQCDETFVYLEFEDPVLILGFLDDSSGAFLPPGFAGQRNSMTAYGTDTTEKIYIHSQGSSLPDVYLNRTKEPILNSTTDILYDGVIQTQLNPADTEGSYYHVNISSTTGTIIQFELRTEFKVLISTFTAERQCIPSKGYPGDYVDNDCDGYIDEEALNVTDTDGEGNYNGDKPEFPARCNPNIYDCTAVRTNKSGRAFPEDLSSQFSNDSDLFYQAATGVVISSDSASQIRSSGKIHLEDCFSLCVSTQGCVGVMVERSRPGHGSDILCTTVLGNPQEYTFKTASEYHTYYQMACPEARCFESLKPIDPWRLHRSSILAVHTTVEHTGECERLCLLWRTGTLCKYAYFENRKKRCLLLHTCQRGTTLSNHYTLSKNRCA